MHDLVIRGGTVFDGTGTGGRTADVVVNDGASPRLAKRVGVGVKKLTLTVWRSPPVSSMSIPTLMRKSFGIRRSVRLRYTG